MAKPRPVYKRRKIKLYRPTKKQPRWTIRRKDGYVSYAKDEADGRHQIDGLCRHVARV